MVFIGHLVNFFPTHLVERPDHRPDLRPEVDNEDEAPSDAGVPKFYLLLRVARLDSRAESQEWSGVEN